MSVHPGVSTPEAAELTKLLENIFRGVNIALVNELAQLCERMGIDVWEVIEAAGTKPFGFMSRSPARAWRPLHPDRPVLLDLEGAGVRLLHRVHRARRQGQREHAVLLPVARLAGAEPRPAALAERSKVLVLGVAYKADIGDTRESPAIKLIELLRPWAQSSPTTTHSCRARRHRAAVVEPTPAPTTAS